MVGRGFGNDRLHGEPLSIMPCFRKQIISFFVPAWHKDGGRLFGGLGANVSTASYRQENG